MSRRRRGPYNGRNTPRGRPGGSRGPSTDGCGATQGIDAGDGDGDPEVGGKGPRGRQRARPSPRRRSLVTFRFGPFTGGVSAPRVSRRVPVQTRTKVLEGTFSPERRPLIRDPLYAKRWVCDPSVLGAPPLDHLTPRLTVGGKRVGEIIGRYH